MLSNISIAVRSVPISEALLPSSGGKIGKKKQHLQWNLMRITADVDGDIKMERKPLN